MTSTTRHTADDVTGDEPEPSTAPEAQRGQAAWRWALAVVACYLLLGGAWVFSNPPAAAPDEPHHLIKAIGMARLDIGERYDEPLTDEPILVRRNLSITRIIEIPAKLDPIPYPCYAFRSTVTAACMPDAAPEDRGTILRETPVGAYPPFAHVPMGLAARSMDTPIRAFLAARLVALASAAAVLYVGIWFLVRELGRAGSLGVFVALTPMAVFASSGVTTSGLEIMGGFTVGAIVALCLRRPEMLAEPRTQYAIGGVGSLLVISRQMGIVELGVLLAVLVAATWRQSWQLVREHRPPFLASAGLLAIASTAVVLWEREFDHPVNTGSPLAPRAVDNFFDLAPDLVHQAVGVFGWLDAPLPGWATWAWLAVTIALCGAALVVGTNRDRLVLGVALAATIGVTFAAYASVFYPIGSNSQGRHLLPLFAFCPTFAAVVLLGRSQTRDRARVLRWSFVVVGPVVATVHFVSLYINARRYAVGTSGPVLFFGDSQWAPAGGWILWLAIGMVGAALLAAVAIASRPQRGVQNLTGGT